MSRRSFVADVELVSPPAYEPNEYMHPALIEKVRSLIGANETILAVWKPTDEQISKVAWQTTKSMAMCPCFWPHMILFCCFVPCALNQKIVLNLTTYVLTNKSVHMIVDEYDGKCGHSAVQTRVMDLSTIIEVTADNVASCGPFAPGATSVRLTLPSLMMSHKHRNTFVTLYCTDPLKVSQMIRDAKNNISSTVQVQVVNQQPTASMPPKRVFVAPASDPENFRIIQAGGTWEEFVESVKEKLSLEKVSSLTFTLDGIPISSLGDIQNNDKLVAQAV
eukprot:Colp12_sorted_trinity150504_noHs@5628